MGVSLLSLDGNKVRFVEVGLVEPSFDRACLYASGRAGVRSDRATQDLEFYTLGVARRDRLPTLTLSLKKR